MDKATLGQYGVYQVAAELCKLGYTAVTTSRNTKAVDILAYKEGKAVGIQVKTVSEWPNIGVIVENCVPEEMGNLQFQVPFVFVYFQGVTESLRYFIVPKNEILQLLEKSWKWYIENSNHKKPIEGILKTRQPLCLLFKLAEPYENKWENLGLGIV